MMEEIYLIFTLIVILVLSATANAKTYATGLVRPRIPLKGIATIIPKLEVGETLPAEFDWREKGISPIQNQGQCGSCWAFSTTATVVDVMKLFSDYSVDLSQQYLVDCDETAMGCGGGYFTAFGLIQNPGSPSQATYPYTAQNGRCHLGIPIAKIVSWSYVGDGQTEPTTEQLKTAIYKYGPISVTVTADQNFMNYTHGVYSKCRTGQTNHMTNLVGWNNATKSWIMRNSWGEAWGEKGFMQIKYTDARGNKCNDIGQEAAIVEVR